MSMLRDLQPTDLYGWTCVFESASEVEAEMIRAYLADRELPVEILNKKDRTYTVGVGHLSQVFVYVPTDHADAARQALAEWEAGTILPEDPEASE